MDEKTLKETDAQDVTGVSEPQETDIPVDETPVQAAEAADEAQAVVLHEDKTPADDTDEDTYDDEDDEDDEEEDDETEDVVEQPSAPPYCDKVFGMYRLALYGICFGYGGGLLVLGLFGIITGIEVTTSSIPGIIGAVIGYFIGMAMTKRLLAKAEAEAAAAEAQAAIEAPVEVQTAEAPRDPE